MPTIESAKKRKRQSEKRRKHNKKQRSKMRTAVKTFEEAIHDVEASDVDLDEVQELLRNAESQLDRAVSKGVIPKSRASRKVGRLKKRFHEFKQGEA